MERQVYPSDIPREQFDRYIRDDLTNARKKTNSRKYDIYDIWAAPDGDGVSLLEKCMRKLVLKERDKVGRAPCATMLIVDSKSIQNADTAAEKGYDAGKKKRA